MANRNANQPIQSLRDLGNRQIKTDLITLLAQPQDATLRTCMVTAKCPSRRLSMMLEVFFEPILSAAGFNQITFYTTNVWTLSALAPGIAIGWDTLFDLETAQQLPRAYEVDSAIRGYMATCTLKAPHVGAVVIPGTWYARASWEPNTPMGETELVTLFNDCDLHASPAV